MRLTIEDDIHTKNFSRVEVGLTCFSKAGVHTQQSVKDLSTLPSISRLQQRTLQASHAICERPDRGFVIP